MVFREQLMQTIDILIQTMIQGGHGKLVIYQLVQLLRVIFIQLLHHPAELFFPHLDIAGDYRVKFLMIM